MCVSSAWWGVWMGCGSRERQQTLTARCVRLSVCTHLLCMCDAWAMHVLCVGAQKAEGEGQTMDGNAEWRGREMLTNRLIAHHKHTHTSSIVCLHSLCAGIAHC